MCFLRCPSRRVSWDAPQAPFCWRLPGGVQVSKLVVAQRWHLFSFSFFLVGSVGDVSRVLLACVLHALGTNPAAVRGFRNRFPRPNFEMLSERFQTSAPGWL